MMRRFKRAWRLVLASWQVIRDEPSLMLFPVLSLIAMLPFFALILGGIFLFLGDTENPTTGQVIGAVVLMALALLVTAFIGTFFSTALCANALARLRGQDPTFGDGMRVASSRFGAIFQFAVVSAVVGLILSFIREKGGFVGGLTAGMGEVAWGFATALAVPTIADQGLGAKDAITTSYALLKRSFGEQIGGRAGISVIVLLPMLVVGLIVAALILLGNWLGVQALVAAGIGLAIVGFLVLMVFMLTVVAALEQVFNAALYHWLQDDQVSPYFSEDLLRETVTQAA